MKERLAILIIGILLASCSANKYLPQGEKYFEGHEMKYIGPHSEVPYDVEAVLLSDLKPEPTMRILISRPGTWLYETMGEVKKDKGLKHFIKYKLGRKPTYLSEVNLDRNEKYVESKMRAAGFFRADVKAAPDTTKHRAKVEYMITAREPYRFDTLFICRAPTALCDTILAAHRADPVIIGGELFRRATLTEARHVTAEYFNNRGYYYFRPEFTYFQADSNDLSHGVDLRWQVREDLPSTVTSVYTIDDVTINLAADSKNTETIGDSIKVIIDRDHLFLKPRKLLPFIAYEPGERYNLKDEEVTLKQLNRLEVFEFVNIQYDPDTLDGNRSLQTRLLAAPRKRRSISAEAYVSTTSTNYTGPGLEFEYYDRNTFRGAEKFRFTATGRYETQLSGSRKGQNSFDLTLLATYLIPRVGLPFVGQSKNGNVPSTKYHIQYRIYHQPQYYSQSNLGVGFGYEWLEGEALHHDLTLVGLDYVKLLKTSDNLERLFDEGILFRESFDNQLILGPSYSITYAPAPKIDKRWRYYIGGSVGLAGNGFYGFFKLIDAAKSDGGQYKVAGVPFAQYARFQTDLRAYVDLDKRNQLVFRQNIGLGVPYLNSTVLPFSKQFFVGGTSSLRGFSPRSVGPGSYVNPDPDFDGYFDQTGDILIEYNVEHRIDLGKYLKGALFVDAGNVWLQNASSTRPGGEFQWKSFLNEFAVASGVGLRIDAQFIIVRFDFAIPLREPYFPEGERWVFDRVKWPWVGDNLILNIAIGYPF